MLYVYAPAMVTDKTPQWLVESVPIQMQTLSVFLNQSEVKNPPHRTSAAILLEGKQ